MVKIAPIIFAGIVLSGCTTPTTFLKNPKTGQVVTCGGGIAGSMLGGVAGYHIEESSDRKCEANYMTEGFEPIRRTSN
jgi:hypothetical protein